MAIDKILDEASVSRSGRGRGELCNDSCDDPCEREAHYVSLFDVVLSDRPFTPDREVARRAAYLTRQIVESYRK